MEPETGMEMMPKVILGSDGWAVIQGALGDGEDSIPEGGFDLELVSVHHPDEERLSVQDFLQRAKGIERRLGIGCARWLLLPGHDKKIPKGAQNKLLIFTSELGKGSLGDGKFSFRGILGLYYSQNKGKEDKPWTPVIYLLDEKELKEFLPNCAVVVCAKK